MRRGQAKLCFETDQWGIYAVFSAILAMEGKCVTSVEGIIEDNVDFSIRNLTKIGSEGMNETDKLVLDIMTHKHCD